MGIDLNSLFKLIAGGLAGIAGILASWFNDIINKEDEFSFVNFLMLSFIGMTIGIVAIMAAPMFHISRDQTVIFSCIAAASHKYIFSSITWFLKKWTTP